MKNRNFISLFFTISLALAGNSVFALQITSMRVNALNQLVIERSGEIDGKPAFEIGKVIFNEKGIPAKYEKIDNMLAEQKEYQANQCTLDVQNKDNFGVYPTDVKLNGKKVNTSTYRSNNRYSKVAVNQSKDHIALWHDNSDTIDFLHKDYINYIGFILNIWRNISALTYLNDKTLVSASGNNIIRIHTLNIEDKYVTENLRQSYFINYSSGDIVTVSKEKETEFEHLQRIENEDEQEEKQRKDKKEIEESNREEIERKRKADNASWLSKIKFPSFITPKTIFCGGVIVAAILFAYYKGHLA